ncbi:MAG: TIM barrel protein [Bryobacteraceae bacterium]|nr:TIM barrel protein [Bryobacteraceae bacterium]
MTLLNRRSFLGAAAASTLAPALSARTLKTVGVQLYTVRSVIGEKTEETIKALEAVGFREAECVYGNLDKVWKVLKQTSIKPVSLHLETQMFTKNQDKLPAALDDAKSKGFQFVVCPYIAQEDRGGEDVIRRLGETLNKAGEVCRKSGLELCYHNHAFEFAEAPGKGTLLDVLMATADPTLVSLELDIMWSQVAGVDPVSVIKKYGKRIALMHLKDLAKDTPQRFDEGIPRTNFREVGTGFIDFKSVLKAAQSAGVRHYFVEQDQTPGNPVESLRQSFANLAKLNF